MLNFCLRFVLCYNFLTHQIDGLPEFYGAQNKNELSFTIFPTQAEFYSCLELSVLQYVWPCSSVTFFLPLSFCHLFCVLTNCFEHDGNCLEYPSGC